MMLSWFQKARNDNNPERNNSTNCSKDGPTLVEMLKPRIHEISPEQWLAIVNRAQSHPHELRLRSSSSNETPLFLSIQRDAPTYVIRTFLQVYPAAAREVQHIGLTALHLAVARGLCSETIGCIVRAWPEAASKRMTDGCVPLHFVRNVPTAKILLSVCPSSIHSTNNAYYLPLHRVVYASYASPELVQLLVDAEATIEKNNHNLQQQRTSQILASTWNGITPLNAACEMVERDIIKNKHPPKSSTATKSVCPLKWKKLEIVARAAYWKEELMQQSKISTQRKNNSNSNIMQHTSSFTLLHALVRFDCPITVIRYTLQQFPKLRNQKDIHGRTPLSIAASRRETSSVVIKLLLNLDGANTNDHDDGTSLQQQKLSYDVAMSPDDVYERRLPLHLAIVSGRQFDDGINDIWKAAPETLLLEDPVTGLCPPILAAADVGCGDMKSHGLTPLRQLRTIYSLLREAPWLIPLSSSSTSTIAPSLKGDSAKIVNYQNFLSRYCMPPWDETTTTIFYFLLPIVAASITKAVLSIHEK